VRIVVDYPEQRPQPPILVNWWHQSAAEDQVALTAGWRDSP